MGRQRAAKDAPALRKDALFLIASITKPLTATAIMMLLERGRLTLDNRVVEYVPAFAANGKRDVLIRHLLTHTSGLPDMLPDNEKLRRAHRPLAAFVEGTCALPLLFPPGTRVNYQSMGIAVLAEIVHQIAGVALSDFLAKEVFGPLEMNDTMLGVQGARRSAWPGRAVPAALEKEDWNWNSPYWLGFGAPWGGLLTTPSDFASFCQMMLQGGELGKTRILSPASVRAMTTNQLAAMPRVPEEERRCRPWGLGWRLNWPGHSSNFGDLTGPRVYGHWGDRNALLDGPRHRFVSHPVHDPAAGTGRTIPVALVEYHCGGLDLTVAVRPHWINMKTPRTIQLPRFYTHGIGSLPRPRFVRDLLAKRGQEDVQRELDDCVRFAIRLQEQAGLDVVSDGEWRRSQYIREFLERVGGFERCRKFTHQGEAKLTEVVVRRMSASTPVFAEDARFLRANTKRVTKFALPSPFLIAVRYWHEDYSRDAYPTLPHFLDHLAEILAREAKALVQAGIDIVQIDDPALTYFCDPRLTSGGDIHDERLRRSWDIDRQFPEALAAINRVADGLGAEVHLHCCHSVYKRQSDVTGNYKPILPRLAEAKIDRVNLEFAYPGTGDVSDLQLLPPHLSVGMGVIDVRQERLQNVDEIAALASAGAKIVGPERIALNPDCGFAPDAGEPPTIDEAYDKLYRLVAAARQLRMG